MNARSIVVALLATILAALADPVRDFLASNGDEISGLSLGYFRRRTGVGVDPRHRDYARVTE